MTREERALYLIYCDEVRAKNKVMWNEQAEGNRQSSAERAEEVRLFEARSWWTRLLSMEAHPRESHIRQLRWPFFPGREITIKGFHEWLARREAREQLTKEVHDQASI